jgi:hypothetical protein
MAQPPGPTGSQPKAGLTRSWVRFWFAPADPTGLHIVRVLTGILLLAWLLLTFRGDLESFFGMQGWVDSRAFAEASRMPGGVFTPSWSVLYLFGANATWMTVVFWTSVVVLAAFTLGVLPRITAVLAWIIVASFTANPAFEYEGDALLLILAFYLMIAYLFLGLVHGGGSLRSRLLGPIFVWPLRLRKLEVLENPPPSTAANLALRLLQVHLALIFVTSGLHKLQFGDWWAGVALWFPLHPPFQTTLADATSNKAHAEVYLSLLNIGAYATLAWQIGFPLFAWRPRWRPVLLGGAAIGCIGSVFLWHLPWIGPALLIGCLSFISAEGWRRLFALLPARSKEGLQTAVHREAIAPLVTAGQR